MVVLVVLVMLVVVVVVVAVLWAVLLLVLGFRLRLGIGLGFEDRDEVEDNLLPEVWGEQCRAGGLPGLLPGGVGSPMWQPGGLRQPGLWLRLWLWPWPCG